MLPSTLRFAVIALAVALVGCAKAGDKVSTADSSAPTAAKVDSEKVGATISWDAATKTATIPIVAGMTSSSGGWNFNGYARGEMHIVVPVGAKIVLRFSNENVVPHSVMIVAGSEAALPTAPGTPAFRGAATRNAADGLLSGGTDEARFTAAKAGKYLLACGIPGHAQSGMWDWFEVSATAQAPSVSTSNK